MGCGYGGSFGLQKSATAHCLRADGCDRERNQDEDVFTRKGFLNVLGKCRRLKKGKSLAVWAIECSLWGYASISVHERHFKDQFDQSSILEPGYNIEGDLLNGNVRDSHRMVRITIWLYYRISNV